VSEYRNQGCELGLVVETPVGAAAVALLIAAAGAELEAPVDADVDADAAGSGRGGPNRPDLVLATTAAAPVDDGTTLVSFSAPASAVDAVAAIATLAGEYSRFNCTTSPFVTVASMLLRVPFT